MIDADPLLLSRIQFAANVTFHILFPAITIALGWVLLFFKLRFNKTRDDAWMQCYFFFTKVFALSFALGVVSGVTMSFQFGTNWPGFMETVGNVAGPLLAYEVLTAFFLEATFLGIMLFGFRRVPNAVHTLATILVAGGTTLSAFWIIVLNSWMHTPAGIEMLPNESGMLQAHVTDWMAVIFNPSMPYRLSHMLTASALTAAFLIGGLSSYRWLRGDHAPSVQYALKTAIFMGALLIPLQIFLGHEHGLNTKEYQPAKLAAMEGAWETKTGAPLVLFGFPNEAERRNDLEIRIPYLASLIVTHTLDGEIKGLNDFEAHPPVATVFWSFRVMVGLGLLMLVTTWLAAFFLLRRRPLPKYLLWGLVGMTFSGNIATVAGWYVTEIGRQPWLVQDVLRTHDALGTVSGGLVLSSLTAYLFIYAFLTSAYVYTLFFMARKAGSGESRDPETKNISGAERHAVPLLTPSAES